MDMHGWGLFVRIRICGIGTMLVHGFHPLIPCQALGQALVLSHQGDLCKTQQYGDDLLRFSICQVGFSYRFPPTRE